ncbi:hypothetical protein N2152v2_004994 [Parachlorella kessleri]
MQPGQQKQDRPRQSQAGFGVRPGPHGAQHPPDQQGGTSYGRHQAQPWAGRQQQQQPQPQPGAARQRQQPQPGGSQPRQVQPQRQQPQWRGQGSYPTGPPFIRPRQGGGTAAPIAAVPAAAAAAPGSSRGQAVSLPERLVGTAGDTLQALAGRVSALQQLHQALYAPSTQAESLQKLNIIWPRLVALLWDPQPAVCAAAAGPVGALGALAAQAAAAQQAQRGITNTAGGMLFDWLLPVLTKQATPQGSRLTPEQSTAILLALRNCLSGVDAVTLARYANAVFEVCQGLLEDEGTSPQLVAPLLEVVMQASKHHHSLRGRFSDLVDVLLGWALEPALPPAARQVLHGVTGQLLARTFLGFKSMWLQQPAFAGSLLGGLLGDLERFAGASAAPREAAQGASAGAGAAAAAQSGAGGAAESSAHDGSEVEGDAGQPMQSAVAGIAGPQNGHTVGADLGKVLGLLPCVLAILEASWEQQPEDEGKVAASILRLTECLGAAVRQLSEKQFPAAAEAPAPDGAPTLAELAGHLSRLAELAAKLAPPAEPAFCAEAAGTAPASPGTISSTPSASAQVAPAAANACQLAASLASALGTLSLSSAGPLPVHTAQQEHGRRIHGTLGVPTAMGSAGGSSNGSTAESSTSHATQRSMGSGGSTAQQLQQAFAAATCFVETALGVLSIASRPDAVAALLSLLRRWLVVAKVLEQREADAELATLWREVEGKLMGGSQSPSRIAKLRLCNDATVLQRTAELYLAVLNQSPSGIGSLLEEINDVALELAAHATQVTQQPAQQAQQVGHEGTAGSATDHGGSSGRRTARLALQLRFDLELLAALFLPLGQPGPDAEQQRAARKAEQAQQAGQPATGEVDGPRGQAPKWRSSAKTRAAAAVPPAWALLYCLVGPQGPLVHHTALWGRSFELLHTMTTLLAKLLKQDTSKRQQQEGQQQQQEQGQPFGAEAAVSAPEQEPGRVASAGCHAVLFDVMLCMLRLHTALLAAASMSGRRNPHSLGSELAGSYGVPGDQGPADAEGLGAGRTVVPTGAADPACGAPARHHGLGRYHPLPTAVVLAVLQQTSLTMGQLHAQLSALGSSSYSSGTSTHSTGDSGHSSPIMEAQRAVAALVGLAACARSATVRAAALSTLQDLLVPKQQSRAGGNSSSRTTTSAGGSASKTSNISASNSSSQPDESAYLAAGVQAAIMQSATLAAAILQAALEASSDLAPAVAQQAQQLLQAAGASLVLAATRGSDCPLTSFWLQDGLLAPEHSISIAAGRCDGRACAGQWVLDWTRDMLYAVALQPQHRAFKPVQLTKLFNYLTGGAPTAVLTAGADKASYQLKIMSPMRGFVVRRDLTALVPAATFVVHEAARQFVAARLKTHFGGPAQTLAALEQGLQRLAAGHAVEKASAANHLLPSWLFLEFLHSLEQGVFNAYEGSVGRPAAQAGALAFFAGNKKVCQDWFARLCPLALRAAASMQHHPLTLRLGYMRLRQLELQGRQLAAAAAALQPSPGVGVALSAAGSGQSPKHIGLVGMPASTGALAALRLPSLVAIGQTSGAGAAAAAAAVRQPAAEAGEGRNPPLEPPSLRALPGIPQAASASGLLSQSRLGAGRASLPRHMVQAQQLWQRVGYVTAVMARALCLLRDPDGVAELQSYCTSAFGPLWRVLHDTEAPVAAQGRPSPFSTLHMVATGDRGEAARHLPRLAGSQQQERQPAKQEQQEEQQFQDVEQGGMHQSKAESARLRHTEQGTREPGSSFAEIAWDWLEAVQLHAAGRYEAALRKYSITQLGSRVPGPIKELVGTLTADAYAAVQDWDSMQAWLQDENHPSSQRAPQSAHHLALASWATGDTGAAQQHLAQLSAPTAASIAGRAATGPQGLLQGALASAQALQSATLRALVMQQAAAGRQTGSASQAGSGSEALKEGSTEASHAIHGAVQAVLLQAQLVQGMGGGLADPQLLAGSAASLASLATAGAASEDESREGAKLATAGLLVTAWQPGPFSASLLQTAPWAAFHSLPEKPTDTPAVPDVAPLTALLNIGGGGSRLLGSSQPALTASLLLQGAYAACASGNTRLAGLLLNQTGTFCTTSAATEPAPRVHGAAWHQAVSLEVALGRLCLSWQLGASGEAAAAEAQQVWQLFIAGRSQLEKHQQQLAFGGKGAHVLMGVGSHSAAAAILLLRWAGPTAISSSFLAGKAGAVPAVPVGGDSSAAVVSTADAQAVLEEAKSLVSNTQLPWMAHPSGVTGCGTSLEQPAAALALQAWESELAAATEAGPSQGTGEALAAQQRLLAYAAAKAGLAAMPQCAQLWRCFAGWAAEQAAGPTVQGSAAKSEASTAALVAYCQALRWGPGTSDPDLPALLHIVRGLAGDPQQLSSPAALQAGLAAVPPSSWLAVLPQLFAVLAHSHAAVPSAVAAAASGAVAAEPAAAADFEQAASTSAEASGQATTSSLVRGVVLSTLGKVAQLAPCDVLLPALVELREPHAGNEQLLHDLRSLVQGCVSRHPLLLEQLSTLTHGLSRAAVLWEEQWHTLLQEAAAAASKGLGTLEADLAAAAAEEKQLQALQDGYLSAMAPTELLLQEGVHALADAPPGSPHEEHMLGMLGPMLRALCEQLTSLPTSAADLAQRTQAIRQAAAQVGQQLLDKQLELAQVVPELATLRNTAIPMPGEASSGVTIQAILPAVHVLHTKTRPKRLTLLGSNGNQYEFLLKGKEDLRTDERLCQFLRAAGHALGSSGGAAGRLELPSFQVTPVARRAGLVQWVENTVPLYELYTAWHARRAERTALLAKAQQQAQGGAATKATPAKAQKPVEAFYAALVPALKAAGVDPASPRKQWPQAALQQAFRALAAAAPHTMISDELWCGAGGAAHWWERRRAYAQSTAAISMVGHLLGLGDRHLDNILLHKQHGRVVHLDFNVIFDRGMALKVPEMVPFRLTQSLVAALGAAGAQGRFRVCCQRALRLLRANAEPLSTLLEASVADPLVDWNAEDGDKARRRAFELASALQLFSLLHARDAEVLNTASGGAAAALTACRAALSGYVELFQRAAAAAGVGEQSRRQLQDCQATLAASDGQEQQAAARLAEGQRALQLMLQQAAPVAELALRALQECQAEQDRHATLVALLLSNPPMALGAPSSFWDPSEAGVCLVGATATGQRPVLELALGMPASDAPVSPHLLTQAAALDELGQQLVEQASGCWKRAQALTSLTDSLQQYAAALAFLLGPQYAATSRHAQWAEAFQAGLALPVPQGFQRAAELAPQQAQQDMPALLPTWHSLAATSAATSALLQRLEASRSAFQRDRVDLALFANEARDRLLGLLGSASSTPSVPALMQALAEFLRRQAEAVEHLVGVGPGHMGVDEAASPLNSLQPLVLGYTTVAVAIQQASEAVFSELFIAPEGSSQLEWLTGAVQALEGLASLSLELQLLCPAVLGLARSHHAQQLTDRLAKLKQAVAEQHGQQPSHPEETGGGLTGGAGQHGETGPILAAVQSLEQLAVQYPVLGDVLRLLQQVHATSALLAESAGAAQEASSRAEGLAGTRGIPENPGDPEDLAGSSGEGQDRGAAAAAALDMQSVQMSELQHDQVAGQLWLVQTACGIWQAVAAAAASLQPQLPEQAAAAQQAQHEPGQHSQQLLVGAWEGCSGAVAAAMNHQVSQVAAPAVAALFKAAAEVFAESAAAYQAVGPVAAAPAGGDHSAARQPGGNIGNAAGDMPALPPGHTDLVPFTHWDDTLDGGGEPLEPLEPLDAEQGEPAEHALNGEAQQTQRGVSPGPHQPSLVPFTHFDEGLEGMEGLLEPLEPEGGAESQGVIDSWGIQLHGGSDTTGGGWEASKAPSQLSGEVLDFPSQHSQQHAPQLSQLSQASSGWAGGTGAGGAEIAAAAGDDKIVQQQLAAALGSCADAAGALAAVDSLQYLTGLALQQCSQQAQQAAAELARLEWLHEGSLLAQGVAPGQLGSWAKPSGITAEVLGDASLVHPLVSRWVLRSRRSTLLHAMQTSATQLAGLDQQLQRWQASLAQQGQQLESEVAAVMLFALPGLKGLLGSQQHWLSSTAGYSAALVQLAQAVLSFENSRTELSSFEGGQEQQASSDAAAQQAQHSSWQQFEAVLRQMQGLHQSYMAADDITTAANRELAGVHQRRMEALAIMQSAQAKTAEAEVELGSLALPLIKATLQLVQGLRAVVPQLDGLSAHTAVLQQAQRQAFTLCTMLRRAQRAQQTQQQGLQRRCQEASQELLRALGCMGSLPGAVRAVQQALNAAHGAVLQKKGKGEAAARQTAVELVTAMRDAIEQLQPQVEGLPAAGALLGTLPSMLGSLAQQAAQQAARLAQEHSLQQPLEGLPSLLGLPAASLGLPEDGMRAASPATANNKRPEEQLPWHAGNGSSAASLALTVGLPALLGAGAGGQQGAASAARRSREAATSYAASVVATFRAKLRGTWRPSVAAGAAARRDAVGSRASSASETLQQVRQPTGKEAGGSEGTAGGSSGSEVGVEELVDRLIGASMSEANLARMFEGWMAWV